MKRPKTRYTNAELAHAWAHKLLPAGHDCTSGNMHSYACENHSVIYSYGGGWVLGVHHKSGRILCNSETYGPTTSQHQWKVRCALTCTPIWIPFQYHAQPAVLPTGPQLVNMPFPKIAARLRKWFYGKKVKLTQWKGRQTASNYFDALAAMEQPRTKKDRKMISLLVSVVAKRDASRAKLEAKAAAERARREAIAKEAQALITPWLDSLPPLEYAALLGGHKKYWPQMPENVRNVWQHFRKWECHDMAALTPGGAIITSRGLVLKPEDLMPAIRALESRDWKPGLYPEKVAGYGPILACESDTNGLALVLKVGCHTFRLADMRALSNQVKSLLKEVKA